jgi:hypothetical protein
MSKTLGRDPTKTHTDIKIHKDIGFRFRKLGYAGLTGEQLLKRVLDVLDKHTDVKEEIRNYE